MDEAKKIGIAIADSHPLMRQGIKDIINASDEFEVTIETQDGDELIGRLHNAGALPDICILDTNIRYISTLRELKKSWQNMKVLIFSLFHSEFIIHEMVCNGANGYIEKSCSNERLLIALGSIYRNGNYFADGVARKVFEMHNRRLTPKITAREIEFLSHCCSDLSYRGISELMHVSVRTVDSYRDTLFSKFSIKTRAGLVMFALQTGLVPLNGVGPLDHIANF